MSVREGIISSYYSSEYESPWHNIIADENIVCYNLCYKSYKLTKFYNTN